MLKSLKYAIILLLLVPVLSYATHNRGGEITYKHLFGNTYEFTITICTDITPGNADRPELSIDYGDGIIDTVPRSNITIFLGNHQKNEYIAVHSYTGAGSYFVQVQDPNRNNNILNIVNSIDQVFCIETMIVISPFIAPNNSAQFDFCPCPEFACINQIYCFNPLAYDVDGDSLSFELVIPRGNNCVPMIPIYQFPNQVNNAGSITIDPITGTICWDRPNTQGQFNIAFYVHEWRKGVKIGSILRDYQLTVIGACSNNPPNINTLPDTCIVAGTNFQTSVQAFDPDNHNLTLTAYGLPFNVPSQPAVQNQVNNNTLNIAWQTNCTHVRKQPYQILLEAKDNPPVSAHALTSFSGFNIQIVAPSPTGLSAAPFGNNIILNWNPSICSNALGYKIYRKLNSGNIQGNNCCDPVAILAAGYIEIADVFGLNNTTYTDVGGLSPGEEYCYVITAYFGDNYESCPSAEACSFLLKEFPIITHVSVLQTSTTVGIDSVAWAKPLELDTALYPGPYFYRVYHGTGFNTANTLVFTTPVSALLSQADTVFIHANVNTVNTANTYKVELYRQTAQGDALVGSSNVASSVFLTLTPNDNEIALTWNKNVPWLNTAYEIYKGTSIGGVYTLIATINTQSYVDTGLVNGQTYCYYIRSIGSYSDPTIVSPLLNKSQEVCAEPWDFTPPCPPVLSIDSDCELELNTLNWTNPNDFCADDVTRYNVYFSPTQGGAFTLLTTIAGATNTTFTHNDNGSIAGCYVITALDSIQFNNESLHSNMICVDNCPIYFLPNVFTPNGDGSNDYFSPILPYKYIDGVEFEAYNRWGELVYSTTNPDIRWDGIVAKTGKPASEGVYYYICKVYGRRLSGEDITVLTGYFHLIRQGGGPTQ
ncbi:MAG: fibronectin type III domain-containing protein [Flavobacteriales bacterium]